MKNLSVVTNTDKFIVAQSNDLIEANYPPSMTARAHKTARLVLALISPDDKDLRAYTITIDALKRYLGMKAETKWGAFYRELKSIQDKLNEHPIEVRKPDGGYIRTPFLGLDISPKQGTVTFEISGLLKPYLLELKKNYTSYLLSYIPKLKSGYSIRLYELLHQYRKIGKRKLALNQLQKKVGSNYPKYSNFKIKVLKQAQKDLKKYTDLAFVFDELKEGRKVVGIQFIIFGNSPEKENPRQLSFLNDSFEVSDVNNRPALSEIIIKTLSTLGISEQNIAKYLAKEFEIITDKNQRKIAMERCKTLEAYYLEKLDLTKNAASKDNNAGFLIKALQEDWVTTKAKQEVKKREAMQKRRDAEKQLKSLESQIEKLTKEKNAIKDPIIEELISDDNILQTAYDKAMSEFEEFMKNYVSPVRHLPIRKQYTERMVIQSSVNMVLIKTYPDKFKNTNAIETKIQKIQAEIEVLKKG